MKFWRLGLRYVNYSFIRNMKVNGIVLLALIYGPVVPYGVTKEQESKCDGLRDVWISGE